MKGAQKMSKLIIEKEQFFQIKDIKREKIFKGIVVSMKPENKEKKSTNKLICMGFSDLENMLENDIIYNNVYRELNLSKKYKKDICYAQKRRYSIPCFIQKK